LSLIALSQTVRELSQAMRDEARDESKRPRRESRTERHGRGCACSSTSDVTSYRQDGLVGPRDGPRGRASSRSRASPHRHPVLLTRRQPQNGPPDQPPPAAASLGRCVPPTIQRVLQRHRAPTCPYKDYRPGPRPAGDSRPGTIGPGRCQASQTSRPPLLSIHGYRQSHSVQRAPSLRSQFHDSGHLLRQGGARPPADGHPAHPDGP
jgi:hypothetical protein